MKRALERRLADVAGFDDPDVEREQYPTPAGLAAHLLHTADLRGDLDDVVLDLGTGTGMLALGAACRDPARVVGLDVDGDALAIARANESRVAPETPVAWVRGDARDPPLDVARPVTVVMNPPFGAQRERRHADRRFLATAADLADVSWSIHNAGSRDFAASFAADEGGAVTDAFAAEFDVARQFDFHTSARETLDVEVYRIDWSQS
ncbi:predicted RNA methylase [Halarchaeum acidiphilum MH1-52-1]|uniref:Predicted RNA methylase n=1 Tax=Halarchaeum acidiphilum MH1-52-1 TaxID=1261545 RepID=U3ADX0_9EURY|nr:METTL5 family protein [Halarchaeum acidiphilum]GAD52968.1 predicted RNA methylase [Halarchaeum acidiphilum MH1-52-1]